MARPRKEIDQKNFEKLCAMQCTREEISDFFDVSHDTLERWCKRTYKENFASIYSKKRSGGKISLRRTQWKLAEHSTTMAIWLGKQYLGQVDNPNTALDEEEQKAKIEQIRANTEHVKRQDNDNYDDDDGVILVYD